MAYRDKLDPTKDGFQELWDSQQDPTIEQVVIGIQSNKTTRKQLLEKIRYFRNSHSTLDIELDRYAEYTSDYNDKYAVSHQYNLGTTQALMNRTQSQNKRWREMLKITAPRYNNKAKPEGTEQSLYEASYLTHNNQPYQADLWGPASYGTLVYDLHDEITFLIDHLEDGKRMTQDVLAKEELIDQDPEWKEQLFNDQYMRVEEKMSDTIERYSQAGVVNTDNPFYKKMLSYDNQKEGISKNFHKPSETQFSDFVVATATLKQLNQDTSPVERKLLGDNIDHIRLVRMAMEHIDELLTLKPNGQYDSIDIVSLIYWCGIRKSFKKHKDNEHEFYERYIKATAKATHRWPAWNTVFTRRDDIGTTSEQRRAVEIAFDRKFKSVCGVSKFKKNT